MPEMLWLPNPGRGTPVCVGLDGSENDDWTALQCETIDGFSFTPRYGPDRRPAIWNPAEWGGDIPRTEVHAAVNEIFATFTVARMYCDPYGWYSEIGDWSIEYGVDRVFEWPTNKLARMYAEIKRFEVDLAQGRIKHDGCPVAAVHIANAKKKAQPGQKYTLDKPNGASHQKIDVAMSKILAHAAASDALVDGWKPAPKRRRIVVS